MNKNFLIVGVCALLGSAACAPTVFAHEIEANRATVVLRDRQHLSLTFFLDLINVLHQTLAPKQMLRSFVLNYAAMSSDEFQKDLDKARKRLQGSTFVSLPNGKKVHLSQWVWPDRAAVQALFQQRAMQAVVAPGEHTHVVPVEIRVEVKTASPENFSSLQLQFPAEFDQILVVYYAPRQIWVKPGNSSSAITF
jgi:hypothetical protein